MGDDSTTTPAKRGWEHFVKVLGLRDSQQKALEQKDVCDIHVFRRVWEDEGAFFEQFGDAALELFPLGRRVLLHAAWEWLNAHQAEIDTDDDDDSWFVSNFGKSFVKEVARKKRERAAEDQRAQQQEEAKRYRFAEPHQSNASAFTAGGTRTMQGIATLPPIYLDHLVPPQVKEHFTSKFDADPTEKEKGIVEDLLAALPYHGTTSNLKAIPETRPNKRTIHDHHLDFIAKQFDGQVTTERPPFRDGLARSSKRTLGDIGLIGGISSPRSYPEAYFHTGPLRLQGDDEDEESGSSVNFITTSMFECKDTSASPDSGHGEGIANATNAAVAMATIGIPCERIVVPVFTTTGGLVQVAAVYMLEPSLPTVCFVTPKLDLFEQEGRLKAAKILIAMSRHCNEMEQYVAANANSLTRVDNVTMRLDNEKYHIKSMADFFPCLGEGAEGASFSRMLDVTRQLADTDYACLPIATRLKDDKDGDLHHDAILFEKLVDYCIGFPHDASDRLALVSEMEKVVADMHEKGVVHMDPYLSNFMWKKENDSTFSVKIIDFDAAHKLGTKLTNATLLRLKESKSDFITLGVRATLDHDNLYMKMLREKMSEGSLRVAGPSESEQKVKSRLDSACTSMVQEIFVAGGSPPSG